MNKKNSITNVNNKKATSKVIVAKKVPIVELKKEKKKIIKIIGILIVVFISIVFLCWLLYFILPSDILNKYVHHCEKGYDYIDGYCETDLVEPPIENVVCSNNQFHEENGECVAYINAFENAECPMGYSEWLGKCKKLGTMTDYSKCGYNSTYDFLSNICYAYVPAIISYRCSSGILEGTSCRIVNNNFKGTVRDCLDDYEYNSELDVCKKHIKKDLNGNIIN